MTQNTFLISDTHFSHQGVCEFLNDDGSKLRPWNNAAEMDEELVKRWNEVVKPNDKVYHLGDVSISHKAMPILDRLNGDKVLIKGNHDIHKMRYYTPYFRDIRAYHVVDKLIFSHIPIHPDSKARFRGNVHGHLHGKRVVKEDIVQYSMPNSGYVLNKRLIIDPFYFCVAVENIDFKPIAYEEILKHYEKQN